MHDEQPSEDKFKWRDLPVLFATFAPMCLILFGFVALGAYLPLETRLTMVTKLGAERALFWQIAGWIVVIAVWFRVFIVGGAYLSGAFPSVPAMIFTLWLASFFLGWSAFAVGTLCGISGY